MRIKPTREQTLSNMRAYSRRMRDGIKRKRAVELHDRKCDICGGWVDPMRRRGIKHCDRCIKTIKCRPRKRDYKAERAARLARAAAEVVEVMEPCRLCGDAAWQGNDDNGHYCLTCRQTRHRAVVEHILARIDAENNLRCQREFKRRRNNAA